MNESASSWEAILRKLLVSSPNPVTSYVLENLPELVSIRRRSGVTLEQISKATRIPMPYLQAIEDGSLGKLPGGVYTSNYLRQYAEACREPMPPTS